MNLLITPTLLPRLSQVLARLQALGIRRVAVLRPKPPAIPGDDDTAWYDSNRLRRTDLLRLRAVLNAWQRALALEVDSALVSLMGDASPSPLRRRGIYGCTAGQRICTVWPDGRVTPCSFLGDLDAGNVRHIRSPSCGGRDGIGSYCVIPSPGRRAVAPVAPLPCTVAVPAASLDTTIERLRSARACLPATQSAHNRGDESGKRTPLQLQDRLPDLSVQLSQEQRAL